MNSLRKLKITLEEFAVLIPIIVYDMNEKILPKIEFFEDKLEISFEDV